MSLQNPGIILFDMSFQLSFLATLGILIFMSYFERWAERWEQRAELVRDGRGECGGAARSHGGIVKSGWRDKCRKYLYEGFAVTISAQIFTMPLILFRFGRVSLIAPVSNIIFLPVIPLIMLFAFAAIVISFMLWPVSILAAGAAFILCDFMIKGVAFTADIPLSAFTITAFPFWMMLVCYALIVGALRFAPRVGIISFRKPRSG